MGSFLDKPVTEKETLQGDGNGLVWGCSAMQGWRVDMEDSHTCIASIPSHPEIGLFCVFDGHGGSLVSTRACVDLLPAIEEIEEFKASELSAEALSKSLYEGLLSLDAKLRQIPELAKGEDLSGSTAITSFISPTHIVIGNTGDSRAVLARNGTVEFGSEDHKPNNDEEKNRIKNAGGFIEMGRVCGNLAVSRALGDFQYKDKPELTAQEQKVTAAADMTTIERTETDEFLLLCCDGIWDVMSNEQAVEFVTEQLKGGFKAPEICERLLDHCLLKNSKDNMSALLVLFENAPKSVPGYEVPNIEPDEEDRARMEQEAAEQAAITKRLSSILGRSALGEALGGAAPRAEDAS